MIDATARAMSPPTDPEAPRRARGGRRRPHAAFALAAAVGALHYAHVSTLHEKHLHFSHLSDLERELSFRTEQGFYYGFFKRLAGPGPRGRRRLRRPGSGGINDGDGEDGDGGYVGGIRSMLADETIEFPHPVNALERFNVYPEVILAGLYRAYSRAADAMGAETVTCYNINRGADLPPASSCEGWGDPAYFYVRCVFLLSGASAAILVLTASLASGGWSLSPAVLAAAALFFHHGECTRVMWAPPLRESFGHPALLAQQLAVLHSLGGKGRAVPPPRAALVAIMTVVALLPWQFSQFAILLEGFALYGAHLVAPRSVPADSCRRVLLAILSGGTVSWALQFGNRMLLTGYPASGLIAASILLSAVPRLSELRPALMVRLPVAGALLVGTTLAVRAALGALLGSSAGGRDDDGGHIGDLLRAKFDPAYRTFDTMLYLCAPEFRFYDPEALAGLSVGLILPGALAASALGVRRLSRSTVDTDNRDGSLAFLLWHLAALAALAGLFRRMKLFFTPQLILTAGLLFSGPLFPLPRLRRQSAALFLAGMAARGMPNLRRERAVVGEYSNPALEGVALWIRSHTRPADPIVGPMTIMATVGLTTSRPTYNHPHYEDAGLRRRTRHAYSLYSRKTAEEVWDIHRNVVGAKYAVAERMLCFSARKVGCRFRDLWDAEDPDNAGNDPFCESLFDGRRGRLEQYFRVRFENDEFLILEVMDGSSSSAAARPFATPSSSSLGPAVGVSSGAVAAIHGDSPGLRSDVGGGGGGIPAGDRRYLLYKTGGGEGFNVQRNVFLRALTILDALPPDVSMRWTIVLPPFANNIHWYDRSAGRPWSDFFDMDSLRLGLQYDVVELGDYLSSVAPRVEEAVHLAAGDGGAAGDAGARRPRRFPPRDVVDRAACTPERVRGDNSGWPHEFRLGEVDGGADGGARSSYRASMLGRDFTVGRLRCVEVPPFLVGSDLAPLLSDADVRGVRSVLVDNLERVGWDPRGGERSAWYYATLRAVRFAPGLREAADAFRRRHFALPPGSQPGAEAGGTASDGSDSDSDSDSAAAAGPCVALHLRRHDFLRVRDVPSPSSAGAQLADLVAAAMVSGLLRRMTEIGGGGDGDGDGDGDGPARPRGGPRIASLAAALRAGCHGVFVATDSRDAEADVAEVAAGLRSALRRVLPDLARSELERAAGPDAGGGTGARAEEATDFASLRRGLESAADALPVHRLYPPSHPSEVAAAAGPGIGAGAAVPAAAAREWHEGQAAVIEQILCTEADVFVGTETSYFTKQITEERALLGRHPNTSYGVLCPERGGDDGGGLTRPCRSQYVPEVVLRLLLGNDSDRDVSSSSLSGDDRGHARLNEFNLTERLCREAEFEARAKEVAQQRAKKHCVTVYSEGEESRGAIPAFQDAKCQGLDPLAEPESPALINPSENRTLTEPVTACDCGGSGESNNTCDAEFLEASTPPAQVHYVIMATPSIPGTTSPEERWAENTASTIMDTCSSNVSNESKGCRVKIETVQDITKRRVPSSPFSEISGWWTFLPLLPHLVQADTTLDEPSSCCSRYKEDDYVCEDPWFVFLPPAAQVNHTAVQAALAPFLPNKAWFLGRVLRDDSWSILHHYRRDFEFQYFDLTTAMALSSPALRRLVARARLLTPQFKAKIHVDASYEFAQFANSTTFTSSGNNEDGSGDPRRLTLVDVPAFCGAARMPEEDVALPSSCAVTPVLSPPRFRALKAEDILFAIKTTGKYHATRVAAQKKTWVVGSVRQHTLFFSETDDPTVPTTPQGVPNTERGHAGKLQAILRFVLPFMVRIEESSKESYGNNELEASYKWLAVVDDDTLVNVQALVDLLVSYNWRDRVLIGDRYGFGHRFQEKPQSVGYDYPSGGAGMILSAPTVAAIVDAMNPPQQKQRNHGNIHDKASTCRTGPPTALMTCGWGGVRTRLVCSFCRAQSFTRHSRLSILVSCSRDTGQFHSTALPTWMKP